MCVCVFVCLCVCVCLCCVCVLWGVGVGFTVSWCGVSRVGVWFLGFGHVRCPSRDRPSREPPFPRTALPETALLLDRPKFRSFFPSPPQFSFFSSLSWGSFCGILVVFKRRGAQMCTLGLSGCCVKPQRLWGRQGLHTTSRELQTRTFAGTNMRTKQEPSHGAMNTAHSCNGRHRNHKHKIWGRLRDIHDHGIPEDGVHPRDPGNEDWCNEHGRTNWASGGTLLAQLEWHCLREEPRGLGTVEKEAVEEVDQDVCGCKGGKRIAHAVGKHHRGGVKSNFGSSHTTAARDHEGWKPRVDSEVKACWNQKAQEGEGHLEEGQTNSQGEHEGRATEAKTNTSNSRNWTASEPTP